MITSSSEGEDERPHSLLNFAFRFEILYRFFLTGRGSSTASITGEEEQSFLPLDNNFAVGFLDELYHFFRIGEDTSLLSVSPTTYAAHRDFRVVMRQQLLCSLTFCDDVEKISLLFLCYLEI